MTYDPDADTAPLPPMPPPASPLRRAIGGRMARPTYDDIRMDAWALYDLQTTRAELMGRGPLAYGLEPDTKASAKDVSEAAYRLQRLLDYIDDPPFCDPEEM